MQRYKIDNSDLNNDNTGINFELGIGQDFALDLYQNAGLNSDYIERVKNENINGIVDYEKHIFYPAYFTQPLAFTDDKWLKDDNTITLLNRGARQGARPAPTRGRKKTRSGVGTIYDIDNYTEDVNSITFNLFLREREMDETTGDYGDWETSDTLYWNRWDGTKSGDTHVIDKKRSTDCGDLLGYLGFTDNDIFYQKNALKKSFLRISVYDSPYKQNQKLLYYSTLFFDTNVLYKKYTNIIGMADGEITGGTNFVYDNRPYPQDKCLTASFKCTSKYDDNACSDGFYMYLFDTIVKQGTCTPLYLKVEFNNAKYGKTIPLICPRFKTWMSASTINDTIGIENENFPEDYNKDIIGTDGNPVSYIDMQRLSEDLYIPILVRYNNVKNRFEWYVASQDPKEQTQDIVFNLYEPRINKLKESGGPTIVKSISGDHSGYVHIMMPYAPSEISKMVLKFSATRYDTNLETFFFSQDEPGGSYTNLLELYPWGTRLEVNPWVQYASSINPNQVYYYEMINNNDTYSAIIYDESGTTIISCSGRSLEFKDKKLMFLGSSRYVENKSGYSKIYNIQFYDLNNNLVANYMPSIDESTGQGCLLDTMSLRKLVNGSENGSIHYEE